MRFVHAHDDFVLDVDKNVFYDLQRYQVQIYKYGQYAALRNMARNGVPIQIAMLAHCGYIPKRLQC